ncbi:unnamed protein product [Pleuronectes platessa]|uniref:Uncharacterized protein n=1 Tax=Pleuronectes platessa TaxID=8262 RepID=A0A9N7Y939_PLEPL|nr:unnamed protein product [Pleuronectes platessa]
MTIFSVVLKICCGGTRAGQSSEPLPDLSGLAASVDRYAAGPDSKTAAVSLIQFNTQWHFAAASHPRQAPLSCLPLGPLFDVDSTLQLWLWQVRSQDMTVGQWRAASRLVRAPPTSTADTPRLPLSLPLWVACVYEIQEQVIPVPGTRLLQGDSVRGSGDGGEMTLDPDQMSWSSGRSPTLPAAGPLCSSHWD